MSRAFPTDSVTVVYEILLVAGFVADGQTPTEHVRMGTAETPVYGGGKMGGKLVTTGGRQRFHKPDTDLYVTVGRTSVSFYHRRNGSAPMAAHADGCPMKETNV